MRIKCNVRAGSTTMVAVGRSSRDQHPHHTLSQPRLTLASCVVIYPSIARFLTCHGVVCTCPLAFRLANHPSNVHKFDTEQLQTNKSFFFFCLSCRTKSAEFFYLTRSLRMTSSCPFVPVLLSFFFLQSNLIARFAGAEVCTEPLRTTILRSLVFLKSCCPPPSSNASSAAPAHSSLTQTKINDRWTTSTNAALRPERDCSGRWCLPFTVGLRCRCWRLCC